MDLAAFACHPGDDATLARFGFASVILRWLGGCTKTAA